MPRSPLLMAFYRHGVVSGHRIVLHSYWTRVNVRRSTDEGERWTTFSWRVVQQTYSHSCCQLPAVCLAPDSHENPFLIPFFSFWDSMPTARVTVLTLKGGGIGHALLVDTDRNTVADLKQMIASRLNVSSSDMKLVFRAQPLFNEKVLLKDVGIQGDCTVHVVHCVHGGAPGGITVSWCDRQKCGRTLCGMCDEDASTVPDPRPESESQGLLCNCGTVCQQHP